MKLAELRGQRVAIWGAAREARAALRVLRARFPDKAVTVIGRDASAIGGSDDAAVVVVEREPDLALLSGFDVVVKSPGISPYRAPVPEAEAAGVRFVSGTELWFGEHAGARVVAVTGTKGKSTTTALIAHLLRRAGRRTALAGNIGTPLLEMIEPSESPEFWAVELSSFQTRGMHAVPEVAVVLNLYPEHLDWHGSIERYYADKLALLGTPAARPRVSVLNAAQPLPPGCMPERGVTRFGDAAGFHLRDGAIFAGAQRVARVASLQLPGAHNAQNACAALAAVQALGVTLPDVDAALASFKPLPHRLQPLGVRNGLEYVNDSISTTPHATLAALAHYADRAVTVIVGGHDRGVDWDAARIAFERAAPANLVAIGENGERILAALARLPESAPRRFRAPSLEAAMGLAQQHTPRGGVVLLSPGAPSFGEFEDYVDRGRRFAALAGFDPEAISAIGGMGLA